MGDRSLNALQRFWGNLRTSFWFLPFLIVVFSIVLRTIRVSDEFGFVVSLAVTFSIVLAIGGIGVLIYFVHHIASSIQASSIIAVVAEETIAAVDRLFPSALGQALDDDEADQASGAVPQRVWQSVPGLGNGYIQSVDMAMRARSPSVKKRPPL